MGIALRTRCDFPADLGRAFLDLPAGADKHDLCAHSKSRRAIG